MFQGTTGLSSLEAQKKLSAFGLNILKEEPPPSLFVIFISQFKNPLVYVLLVAGLITVLLNHISDALIIFLALFINAVLGCVQELRAGRALSALKKLISQTVEVFRDGVRVKIDSSLLVPGDIVVISQGNKIPADGVLIQANRLSIDEAILTGESVPVAKNSGETLFMGTVVSSGQAALKITATGSQTRMGSIAESLQEKEGETPLGIELNKFSRKIVAVVISLSVFVFLFGLVSGREIVEMFTTVVALAVSSIPEGLVISLTVILAVGMQRILHKKGLVRRLASAETLGGVSTICVDKTGTLTEGKMSVVDVVGDQELVARQVLQANDLDDPMMVAAYDWAKKILKDEHRDQNRLDSIPFSQKERYFMSLNSLNNNKNIIFVNGAPDILLQLTEESEKEKSKIIKRINELTAEGKRVVGFASKEVSFSKKALSTGDVKNGLGWVGMIALNDPVRKSVRDALAAAREAGIKIIVITGDYANTAEFVLSELGIKISKEEIVLGEEVGNLSPRQLSEKVKTAKLFARTTPEQKLAIVNALKMNNEIVAMMGDGVNDAPAIHKADIGIVVANASDVARESADLVLLDSNFQTIVAAVEEGRGMFENIRKIILYLLSDAFAEIVVIVGGIVLGLPLPLTAVQIIWINLVSDGFPGLTLTIDPKRKGIMHENPRGVNEELVTKWMMVLIAVVSIFAGLIALGIFMAVFKSSADLKLAQSMAFATLGMCSLTYVFSVRSLMVPFWMNHMFENKWLVVAVIAGAGLQILPFVNNATRSFFGVTEIGIGGWAVASAASIVVFFIVELFKFFYVFYAKNLRRRFRLVLPQVS